VVAREDDRGARGNGKGHKDFRLHGLRGLVYENVVEVLPVVVPSFFVTPLLASSHGYDARLAQYGGCDARADHDAEATKLGWRRRVIEPLLFIKVAVAVKLWLDLRVGTLVTRSRRPSPL
jgi:hypothetical protein